MVEDFFLQASETPLDAWASAVESGLLRAVSRTMLRSRPRPRPLPPGRLAAIRRLVPKDLRSVVPEQFLFATGGRAKAVREMVGPERQERRRSGLVEVKTDSRLHVAIVKIWSLRA